MVVLVLIILLGLPAVGALLAWFAALRSWHVARSRISSDLEARGARGRLMIFVVLPATQILFGLVIFFLVLGENIPDATSVPAALASGGPGLFAGLGMSLIFRRGIGLAVMSKRGFARVLTLAVIPSMSAMFGVVVSFFLIGGGSMTVGAASFGLEVTWTAAALAVVGAIGGLLSAWLASSSWDFRTMELWPKALIRSGWGELITGATFGVAMAVLGQWLISLLLVVYLGGSLGLGVLRYQRARRRRASGT